jgi:allantoinase
VSAPGTEPLWPGALPNHGRFAYRPITNRPHWSWPRGKGLAVYIGFNIEHFAFGDGLGACLGPASVQPDVLNYSWREYGNRVGAWRCLELFDALGLPTGALINTALYDHCPELVEAFVKRGDELIGHGHSNAERQGIYSESAERTLLQACSDSMQAHSGTRPGGWLSPWISESRLTPDLLAETGYRYTLNWCHDDQPVRMATRSGTGLWSIPYPQELNDIPMVMARLMDASDFCDLVIDNLDEMVAQAAKQPLVMGIALHPYIMGQPYRLKHLRRVLAHLARLRDEGMVWVTTPGEVCGVMEGLAVERPGEF